MPITVQVGCVRRCGDWYAIDEQWAHAPRWKVGINRILRFFQPQRRKWVVFTRCDESTIPPTALGYGFGRVLHR